MSASNLATANSSVTKRSLGLAGLAAFGACAACCALPLLAAAGVGGGVLSTVAGYIRPGADLVVAGVVGVGVLGAFALRARRTASAAGCNGVCAIDAGCGCEASGNRSIFASAEPSANEPIVCTAYLQDKPTLEANMDGYRAAFAQLLRTERGVGGFRWVFEPRAELDAELRRLAENEHQCCGFFKFEVWAADDEIVWQTTADARAASVLEEFSQLPARLSKIARGQDLAPIKQSVSAAGLVFAADAAPRNSMRG